MNRRIIPLSTAAAFLFAGALIAQQDTATPAQDNTTTSKDTKTSSRRATTNKMSASSTSATDLSSFAKKAAEGGLAEVELGRLASEKASNDRVKQFGQRMVDDHTKANKELKEAAKKDNIDLPTSLDKKDQAEVDKLSKLSGAAFDKAYMSHMVKDHEKDVNEFRKASRSSSSSDVKTFAEKTLPTLEEHLKMARDVHQEVAGSTAKKHTAEKNASSSQ